MAKTVCITMYELILLFFTFNSSTGFPFGVIIPTVSSAFPKKHPQVIHCYCVLRILCRRSKSRPNLLPSLRRWSWPPSPQTPSSVRCPSQQLCWRHRQNGASLSLPASSRPFRWRGSKFLEPMTLFRFLKRESIKLTASLAATCTGMCLFLGNIIAQW